MSHLVIDGLSMRFSHSNITVSEGAPPAAEAALQKFTEALPDLYAGVAVEHYPVDKPSTSIFAGTAGLTPDPLNYGWRDYGMRVGI